MVTVTMNVCTTLVYSVCVCVYFNCIQACTKSKFLHFLCYCSIAFCSMGLGMLYLEFQHVILKQHGRVNALHHQHQAICPCCSSLQNQLHGVWVFGTFVSTRYISCMMCLLFVHELYGRLIEWYLYLLMTKNHENSRTCINNTKFFGLMDYTRTHTHACTRAHTHTHTHTHMNFIRCSDNLTSNRRRGLSYFVKM